MWFILQLINQMRVCILGLVHWKTVRENPTYFSGRDDHKSQFNWHIWFMRNLLKRFFSCRAGVLVTCTAPSVYFPTVIHSRRTVHCEISCIWTMPHHTARHSCFLTDCLKIRAELQSIHDISVSCLRDPQFNRVFGGFHNSRRARKSEWGWQGERRAWQHIMHSHQLWQTAASPEQHSSECSNMGHVSYLINL